MKLSKALLILVVVFAMLGMPHPAAAQIYTYTSGYQVQNLSDQQAVITLAYYSQQIDATNGGTQVTSIDDTIDGLKSKTYFPIHAPAGFKGSVVISSSTPLASIVNLVGNGIGGASYIGSSQGSLTVNLPLLMKANAGITTWYSVQNTDPTNAADVSVVYSDGTTAGPISIKPNASYIFNQGKETHSKAVFAAKLTSTKPIVVVAVQEGTKVKTILATAGFEAGETNAFMPLINSNNSGYNTGVQIQNIGTLDTDITVSYTPLPGIGSPCWEKRTIKAGASETFALAAFAGVAPADVSTCTKVRFVGGAQITANSASQPVVAVVNQTTSKIAGAYNSFLPSKATAKVVMPLIMDRNSGYYTGFTVENVGKDKVTVNCVFTNAPNYTVGGDLEPGGVLLDIQKDKIQDKYVGSATCTATGTGETKIVSVVNEVAPISGDALSVYEGINVAP